MKDGGIKMEKKIINDFSEIDLNKPNIHTKSEDIDFLNAVVQSHDKLDIKIKDKLKEINNKILQMYTEHPSQGWWDGFTLEDDKELEKLQKQFYKIFDTIKFNASI